MKFLSVLCVPDKACLVAVNDGFVGLEYVLQHYDHTDKFDQAVWFFIWVNEVHDFKTYANAFDHAVYGRFVNSPYGTTKASGSINNGGSKPPPYGFSVRQMM